MSLVEYTAKRTLAPGHVANAQYSIELEVVDAVPAVADIKQVERSPGGAMETSFERQDITWTIRLAPVNGWDLQLMREFLDSTESGEYFRIWVWPDDATPLALKRLEDGHSESAFMRCGAEDRDYFEAQFTALQVEAYSTAGGASSGGGDGGGGAGSAGDTTPIYDDYPVGLLDPADSILDDHAFDIYAAAEESAYVYIELALGTESAIRTGFGWNALDETVAAAGFVYFTANSPDPEVVINLDGVGVVPAEFSGASYWHKTLEQWLADPDDPTVYETRRIVAGDVFDPETTAWEEIDPASGGYQHYIAGPSGLTSGNGSITIEVRNQATEEVVGVGVYTFSGVFAAE